MGLTIILRKVFTDSFVSWNTLEQDMPFTVMHTLASPGMGGIIATMMMAPILVQVAVATNP